MGPSRFTLGPAPDLLDRQFTAAGRIGSGCSIGGGSPGGWAGRPMSFLINTQQAPTGRSAGSLAWAGLANTYFCIDRNKRVADVFLSQVPFYDDTAIDLFGKFETGVYRAT